MKDYIGTYAPNRVRKFQMGGPMPEPAVAPAPGGDPAAGGQDVEALIMQAYETQDPQLALEAVNALAEMSGLAGDPSVQGTPAELPQEMPAEEAIPMGRYGLRVPKVKAKTTGA